MENEILEAPNEQCSFCQRDEVTVGCLVKSSVTGATVCYSCCNLAQQEIVNQMVKLLKSVRLVDE
jgi:hypothetical protein